MTADLLARSSRTTGLARRSAHPATSAATGDGVRELRDAVAGVAASRRTALLRLSADLDHLTASFDTVFTRRGPGRGDLRPAGAGPPRGRDRGGGPGISAAGGGRGAVVHPIHVHEVDLGRAARRLRPRPRPAAPGEAASGVREALAHGARRVPGTPRGTRDPGRARGRGAARVRAAAVALWVGVALTVLGVAGIVLALADIEPIGRVDGWYAALAPLAAGVLLALGALYAGRRGGPKPTGTGGSPRNANCWARVAGVADEYLVDPATVELERYREAHAFFVAAREPLHVH
ncbi:hypothetical protein ACU686_44180 [Yinghuangia aomiensis]